MLYLDVPYTEKDQAKQLGARWDPIQKKWYVPDPEQADLTLFESWLPKCDHQQASQPDLLNDAPQEKQPNALNLSELLRQVQLSLQTKFAQAIWVKAEIASMNERRGHVYFELSENDEQGQTLASCRAMIWASNAQTLISKFETVTGARLQEGQKVLLSAQVNFHEKFGFSLLIQDIDPSFTLGEIEANLIAIRNRLIKEGIYTANKQLARPTDLFNIAVISPPNAAGLGDFRAEADQLEKLSLCRFTYFHSAFQGEQVVKEMRSAFDAFNAIHKNRPFDVLVIIRGGGAKLDLNPLNQYELAQAITQLSIPVFTGIGHERDNTILDEVANKRFDTPSKVIHGLWNVISQSAMQAKQNWLEIEKRSQHLLVEKRAQLMQLKQQIDFGQHKSFDYWKAQLEPTFSIIQHKSIERVSQEIGHLNGLMQAVTHYAKAPLRMQRQSADLLWKSVQEGANKTLDYQRQRIKQNIGFILSSGPQSQLNRGFAIAKTQDGKVISSAQQAKQQSKFQLDFHDGQVEVQPLNK